MTDTDPKPWYASRTVWAGIVAALSGIVAGFGVIVDQTVLVDALAGAGAALAGLVAIYGRLVASQPIKRGNSDASQD